MSSLFLLWLVACQPQQNELDGDGSDSGQSIANNGEVSADGGSSADDTPDDPTADVDGGSLGAGPNPCREPVLGRVQSVTDGDTIKVETGRGVERVRLIGIDAPEVDHTGPETIGQGPRAWD